MFRKELPAWVKQVQDRLDALPRMRWVLVCVLVVVVPLTLFYAFSVHPRSEALSQLNNRREVLIAKTGLIQKRILYMSRVKGDIAHAETLIKRALMHFSPGDGLPELLEMVSRTGSGAGLKVVGFTPKAPEHHKFYTEIPVALELRGTYHQAAGFFLNVSRLPRLVVIRDFHIRPEDASAALKITCTAVAYRVNNLDQRKE